MKKIAMTSMLFALSYSISAYALEDGHVLELKINARYFGDEGIAHASVAVPNPKQVDYEQSALGIELNYQSPYWYDKIGLDASLYTVSRIANSGQNTVQLMDIQSNGNMDNHFTTIGILALKIKPNQDSEIKIGRQAVNTLLAKTTTNRAIPDTFSGVSAFWKPLPELKTYLGYYDRWRPRTSANFDRFVTDQNQQIDYMSIIGAEYKWQSLTLNTEYLNSKDYLSKYGAQISYPVKTKIGDVILRSGAFFSQDDGHLFKCGAEFDLDCISAQDIKNDGRGYFVEATWKRHHLELGTALSKFDGMWIEDNYSTQSLRKNILIQDNGTSPFPTSTVIGPDFTNNDELAWMARIKYDWKSYIPNLNTEFKFIVGSGAHQSNRNQNIEGKERYSEFTLNYTLPWLKKLDLRYSYLSYHSSFDRENLSQRINGLLRNDWHQHRISLNYSYLF